MRNLKLFEIYKNIDISQPTIIEPKVIPVKNEETECKNCESCICGKKQEENVEQSITIEKIKDENKNEISSKYPKPETIDFPNVTKKDLNPNTVNKIIKQFIGKSYINYKYLRDKETTDKIVRLAELKREIKNYKKTKHISEEEYKKLLAEQAKLRR